MENYLPFRLNIQYFASQDPVERELRQSLSAKIEEAKKLTGEGKMEEARATRDKAKELREKLDAHIELRSMEEGLKNEPEQRQQVPMINTGKGEDEEKRTIEEKQAEYRSAFLTSLRGKRLSSEQHSLLESDEFRAMSGANDADGGLIIPQDITTKINEFKREVDSLENYVRVEPVSTRSGSRVLEKLATMTPFANVAELATIAEINGPKFQNMTYAIKDYAGILPVSNTLLSDTDQNLTNYIARWIAKKSIVTRNSLILAKLDGLTKKTFDGLDAVKQSLNLDIDPMIAQGAAIITNQSGFNFLDEQKDGQGRYLMQPDPTSLTRKLLFGKPVVVLSNTYFANGNSDITGDSVAEDWAPIIVGDLKEAVVMFDRQQYSILSTNIGAGAFETNQTKIRAIEREDVKGWDTAAAIYGQIALA
ncbi:HK97 family phage major capsid protein [Scopulibacillus darangshiensis]|uniref:HK97 family phage major capsid protein n=1 Tax=Scopulibacillus darangshiensis TaxID=442528 RepID=A0A4R2PDK3_9BACL|nr:phage major capsid protein [Scopulibacillus darangshiensis]TCP32181.1 HK97 family phage major capsid protein [Scopulibacillus darangshiensis]